MKNNISNFYPEDEITTLIVVCVCVLLGFFPSKDKKGGVKRDPSSREGE
jgi:hypothetical protein